MANGWNHYLTKYT